MLGLGQSTMPRRAQFQLGDQLFIEIAYHQLSHEASDSNDSTPIWTSPKRISNGLPSVLSFYRPFADIPVGDVFAQPGGVALRGRAVTAGAGGFPDEAAAGGHAEGALAVEPAGRAVGQLQPQAHRGAGAAAGEAEGRRQRALAAQIGVRLMIEHAPHPARPEAAAPGAGAAAVGDQ